MLRLLRREDGTVLLDGTPVRRWFEVNNVTPVQNSYRGYSDGRCVMCLLTALAYNLMEGDADALHATMDRVGRRLEPGGVLDPGYRRMDQVLAAVIGLDRRDARELEAGWTGDRLTRAVHETRGEATAFWDLGHDAWEQAKEATFARPEDRG